MEGIELSEYVDFIVRASTTDPRPLKEAESKLAPLLAAGKSIRIETAHPDGRTLGLEMSIEPSIPVMSFGLRNFPDGEIFTSPDARSVEGELYLDLPVHYGGADIQGIYLRFERGEIREYSAQRGASQLAAIIETDAGAHRLGEVALGMNPGLDRVLKHPLFVEKVGGTMHVAIGASYETCYVEDTSSKDGLEKIEQLAEQGIINRSAQHIDVVADFRPGGCGRRFLIDGQQLRVREGVWVVD
jgi:aminopeptidase